MIEYPELEGTHGDHRISELEGPIRISRDGDFIYNMLVLIQSLVDLGPHSSQDNLKQCCMSYS